MGTTVWPWGILFSCPSLWDRTLFESPNPLFLLQKGPGLGTGEPEPQRLPTSPLLLPFVASHRGFLSLPWFFVCLSPSVSTAEVYLCLFVCVGRLSATCPIHSPFLHIDFQNSVCIKDLTRRLANVIQIKPAPLDGSWFGFIFSEGQNAWIPPSYQQARCKTLQNTFEDLFGLFCEKLNVVPG